MMSTRHIAILSTAGWILMNRKTPPPSDLADKFMLRLPKGMRELVRVEAEKNGRSMNAEIVSRLERSLGEKGEEDVFANILEEYYSLTDRLNTILPLIIHLNRDEVEELMKRKDVMDLYHRVSKARSEKKVEVSRQ